MKKLFLSMLAAVTLFASCSQEELVSQADGENLVSFTVTTPELGSRAAGDGSTANKLYYAVYDGKGNIVSTISNNNGEAKTLTDKSTTVHLPLLNGETYSILFWAEADARPEDKMATVNWENKSLSVNPTTSNKETYDAFYAYVKPFVVTGDMNETVKLYRPFAQLNIGTTEKDLIRVAQYYGVTGFTQSQVVVTTPTSMDLTTGNVSGEQELTYAAAEFIAPEIEMLKEKYVYLSMNYLLVSNEKNLVNVEFSCISEGENAKSISKTFENIPVQRNYKTNIYGNLFTSATDWTVDVAPGFDTPEYNPAEQLAALFEQGGEMTLYTDVTLAEPLVLTEGKTVTLNLNGNTIKSDKFVTVEGDKTYEDSYPFYVTGGTLNIKGEGTIEAASAGYSMAVFATAGEVNIYGGKFYNAGKGSDLIYAKGTAEINIYGGYFEACEKQPGTDGTDQKYSVLNLHDASKTTASITVYGGSFYQFDPANNKSENPAQSFVADGYSSVAVGDNYVVAKGTAVATVETLTTALNNTENKVVSLVADLELTESLMLNGGNKATLNLNGHNIINKSNTGEFGKDEAIIAYGELTIEGEGTVQSNSMAVWARGNDGKAVITINGGTYKGLYGDLAKGGRGVVYASGKNTINIYGGAFEALTADKTSFANKTEGVYAALNIYDNAGYINVYGGSFYKFNPAVPGTEPTAWNADHPNGFVAEGHTSTQEGDWYIVK